VPHEAKVLTVSSSAHAGSREDRSGDEVTSALISAGFAVVGRALVPDGVEVVAEAVETMAQGFTGLVLTTGGTGFAPSDLTPEATSSVLEREAPGLAEGMRRASPFGGLSRGRAGTIGTCLVLNLPGSPRGAVESLRAVIDLLPHALELLAGGAPH
jgi:molybdopterin adenylyltransferase